MATLPFAFVCWEVLHAEVPILYAVRDEPIDDDDSGWQFLCGMDIDHNANSTPKLCGLGEVVSREPSLAPFIDHPIGTRLLRDSVNTDWKVITPE